MLEAYGDPEISRFDLRFPDLPEGFEGFRIVQLSDLHAGPLIGPNLLKRWRFLAERERPDILVITGDFVDSLPEELDPFTEAFRNFSAPMGHFAILGNHDYFTDPSPIWKGLEAMGYHCLENRHVVLERNGSKMAILGLQDPMARSGRFRGIRFGPGPMPQDVAQMIPGDLWRLGLCHRPSNWDLALEAGARLTLSGHTHGGQINLLPGISSAKMLGPYTSGIYRHNGNVLFVNRGLGVVGLPMRVGAPPEIAVITLRRQEIPSFLPAENQIT
jgi:predicted MPP superfamily phosphohydrolase